MEKRDMAEGLSSQVNIQQQGIGRRKYGLLLISSKRNDSSVIRTCEITSANALWRTSVWNVSR